MRLDLHTSNALKLKLEVDIALPANIIGKLKACFPEKEETEKKTKDKSLALFFGEDYSVNKRKHFSRGFVGKFDESKKDIYTLAVEYSVSGPLWGMEYHKSLRPLSELFDCLSAYDKDLTFEVEAAFLYSNQKFKSALIELPIKLESQEFFDEIRGVRLSKTRDGNVIYTVINDRPDNKDTFNTVSFKYTSLCSRDLPEKVLKHADQISRRLISEK